MSTVDRMADGYQPDWDIDSEVGRQGELFVADLIDTLRAGSLEVKSDAKAQQTGNVYLELECWRRGEWTPSSLTTSTADLWAQYLPGCEVLIVAPTHRVRQAAEKGKPAGCERGSHPTKGVVLPVQNFVYWLLKGT